MSMHSMAEADATILSNIKLIMILMGCGGFLRANFHHIQLGHLCCFL